MTLFCIALVLSFSVSTVVSAGESAHHELEVVQAGSSSVTVICLGNDQSCGLPDHDENHVVPHLHMTDIGLIGLPAVASPATFGPTAAVALPLPACLPVDGQRQQTPERPPRTTCI